MGMAAKLNHFLFNESRFINVKLNIEYHKTNILGTFDMNICMSII